MNDYSTYGNDYKLLDKLDIEDCHRPKIVFDLDHIHIYY